MQYGSFRHPFFYMPDLCSFSPPNSPPIFIPITFSSSTTHTQAHANTDTGDTMETESLIQATFSKFGIGVDFSALQEGCIAGILAWTSPRDACRMSTISPKFLRATESDALWKMFLPANYREIIGRSSESSARLDLSSKNELFFFFFPTLQFSSLDQRE